MSRLGFRAKENSLIFLTIVSECLRKKSGEISTKTLAWNLGVKIFPWAGGIYPHFTVPARPKSLAERVDQPHSGDFYRNVATTVPLMSMTVGRSVRQEAVSSLLSRTGMKVRLRKHYELT